MKITMTEGEFDLLFRQNATRVAPGIYLDQFGDLHWSVPELLALVDLPDTPDNRAACAATVRDVLATHAPDMAIVYVDPPPKE